MPQPTELPDREPDDADWIEVGVDDARACLRVQQPDPDGVALITITGLLCTITVCALRDHVADVTEMATDDVHLDLSGVTFIDGRGLSLLLAANAAVTERGHRCQIIGATGITRRLLTVTELDGLLCDRVAT